jgi:protein tyrosine/serine phosphatase
MKPIKNIENISNLTHEEKTWYEEAHIKMIAVEDYNKKKKKQRIAFVAEKLLEELKKQIETNCKYSVRFDEKYIHQTFSDVSIIDISDYIDNTFRPHIYSFCEFYTDVPFIHISISRTK